MKVSLILPSIRTHLLQAFYESAEKACSLYNWELIIVGPFEPPEDLLRKKNVNYISSYANPSICTQIAVKYATGQYIYNCVDDGLFTPNCIDDAIKLGDAMITRGSEEWVINMRYRESEKGDRPPFDQNYWSAMNTKIGKHLPGIENNWQIALHFFMLRSYYNWLGGVDPRFEYVNHGAHDLMFRIQGNGGIVIPSITEGLICTHVPETTGDHAPIHHAQLGPDQELFDKIYSVPEVTRSRYRLAYWAYEKMPNIWRRRFPEGEPLPETYEEMMEYV